MIDSEGDSYFEKLDDSPYSESKIFEKKFSKKNQVQRFLHFVYPLQECCMVLVEVQVGTRKKRENWRRC